MGEVFAGRYELIDPIGRGGVGAVWRAWDHRRRRYVAAKVLQQSDAHTLLRFVREQATRIDHPHVLAPASWAADDDKVLFTMDLVAGGSLAHLIGDYGPLPPRFVCTLLDQLLSGLTAVHAEGVVHRDIKPANLLLEATGTARPHLRVSDFGISMRKGEPRLTETDYVVGTPGYFAPEQMLGAEPDFPADLFAAGLVALYLLTGTKPDAQALVARYAEHGVPNAPQGVPEPLWEVLACLLQPNPDSRFRTATGARKALTAAVELLPDTAEPEEAVEVFDQLGPLPVGFGPDGPVRERAADGGFAAFGGAGGGAAPHGDAGRGDAGRGDAGRGDAGRGDAGRGAPVHGDGALGSAARGAAGLGGAGFGAAGPAEGPAYGPAAGDPTASGGRAPGPGTGGTHTGSPSGPPAGAAPAAGPPGPPASVSETGSFQLAPPVQQSVHQPVQQPVRQSGPPDTGAQPPPGARPPAVPRHPAGHDAPMAGPPPASAAPAVPDPGGIAQAPTTGVRRDYAATAPYTAPQPHTPPLTASPAPAAPGPGTPAQRRPGPPPKVTIPVLLLALLCFAVGIWALTAS